MHLRDGIGWLVCVGVSAVLTGCGESNVPVDSGVPDDVFVLRRDTFVVPPDAAPSPDAFEVPDAYVRVSCPGYVEPEQACLQDSECTGTNICRLPIVGNECAPCNVQILECDNDNPCPSGEQCVVRGPQCSCPAYTCEPACTGPTCPNAICDRDGYTCPRNSVCDPMDGRSNEHGCRPVLCTTDSDCDCGFCAAGVCAEGLGFCRPVFDELGDAGPPRDVGPIDAAVIDAAVASNDAASSDAGSNDAGSNDAGSNDAGSRDAGSNDAGSRDAASSDAGPRDVGAPDGATNDA